MTFNEWFITEYKGAPHPKEGMRQAWDAALKQRPEGLRSLQRYEYEDVGHPHGEAHYVMMENPDGDWVKYDDVLASMNSVPVAPQGCKQCGGTGTELLIKSLNPNLADTRTCPVCKGTGQ